MNILMMDSKRIQQAAKEYNRQQIQDKKLPAELQTV